MVQGSFAFLARRADALGGGPFPGSLPLCTAVMLTEQGWRPDRGVKHEARALTATGTLMLVPHQNLRSGCLIR